MQIELSSSELFLLVISLETEMDSMGDAMQFDGKEHLYYNSCGVLKENLMQHYTKALREEFPND